MCGDAGRPEHAAPKGPSAANRIVDRASASITDASRFLKENGTFGNEMLK